MSEAVKRGDIVEPTKVAIQQGVANEGDLGFVADRHGLFAWVARYGYRTMWRGHHSFWRKVDPARVVQETKQP